MFVYTGDYLEQASDTTQQSIFYTFTPRPMMDGDFYAMTSEIAELLAEAYRSLGILGGMLSLVPDKEAISDLLLLRESSFSKAVDCPDMDIRSMLAEQLGGYANQDVQNIMSAYQYSTSSAAAKFDFNTVASRAMYGGSARKSASSRDKQIFLSKSSSNYRQYNPTSPDEIPRTLSDINEYLRQSSEDVIIKAAMSHYQFAIVQPYDSSNGTIGRILPYHLMSNANYKEARFLCLSASLYRHKEEYLDRLWATQKDGNYPAWISFFNSIINESAIWSADFIRHYYEHTRDDEERILAHCKDKRDSTPEVYRYFKRNIISGIGQACKHLNLSYAAVSRTVSVLQNLGVLIKLNQNSRNRLFAYDSIMRHFMSLD